VQRVLAASAGVGVDFPAIERPLIFRSATIFHGLQRAKIGAECAWECCSSCTAAAASAHNLTPANPISILNQVTNTQTFISRWDFGLLA
jgi:hypothetical protein